MDQRGLTLNLILSIFLSSTPMNSLKQIEFARLETLFLNYVMIIATCLAVCLNFFLQLC